MKGTTIIIVVIAIAISVIIGSVYAYMRYFGSQTAIQTNTTDKENCRQGNIFDGVDRQARFTVLSTCEKVVGIVYDMKGTKENDGDYQFNLDLEQPYKRLLNVENIRQVNGMLVIEIISKDQRQDANSSVQIPKNDDRVEVYGAWVVDNPRGWNEIHPAWQIIILNS